MNLGSPSFDMFSRGRSASVDTTATAYTLSTPEPPKPAPGVNPPVVEEPYFMLPTKHFSFHHHLHFNPRPKGPQCNCGTWQIWCLPPHLGGCGHVYVQDMLYCGLTVDQDEPAKAVATTCPGVNIRRQIKSTALMMGLCPSCRNDRGVVQTYNNFIAPFFVPKGLPPMKAMEAENAAAATWRAHRLAFSAWVGKNRQEGVME